MKVEQLDLKDREEFGRIVNIGTRADSTCHYT